MMKRLYTLYRLSLTLVFLYAGGFVFGQDMQIIRETTGSSGASSTIVLDNSSYLIQESIGQASVIGTYSLPSTELRQGFLQALALHVSYQAGKQKKPCQGMAGRPT